MNRARSAERNDNRPGGVAATLADVHRTAEAIVSLTTSWMVQAAAVVPKLSGPAISDRLRSRRPTVQPHCAAGKALRVEIPEHEIGIRDGRPRAVETITRRSRGCAGALGSHLHDADRVDPGNAPASSADLDHVDGWDGDGKSARFGETPGARNLEFVGQRQRAVANEAGLCRGAAHVVGEHLR